MSLINQMLQDLDARGSSNVAASLSHAQIKAVSVTNRLGSQVREHAPKIAVMLLIVAGAGFIAWRYLHGGRPAAPVAESKPVALAAPAPVAAIPAATGDAALAKPAADPLSTSLALKMAPELMLVPLPAAHTTGLKEKYAPGQAARKPVAEIELADVQPATAQALKAKTGLAPAAAPRLAQAPVQAVAPARPAPWAPAPKVVMGTANKAVDAAILANASRQGKELTTAQRSENEYRHATTLLQQGRTTEAIGSLEQALAIEPTHSAARQTLISLLLEAHRSDEAMRRLQESLALDVNQPEMAMLLARLYVDKNDLRNAVDVLQKTAPAAGERADYQAFLAAVLQRDKRHKEAVERYTAALRLNPQNGVWWMGLGISLQADFRLREAHEAFVRGKATNTLPPDLLSFVEQKITQLAH